MTTDTDSELQPSWRQWLEMGPRAIGRGRLSRRRQATILRHEAQRLVESLFRPTGKDYGWTLREPDGPTQARIMRDPVNWGDIGVVDVRAIGGGRFRVTLEEADPAASHFAEWVRDWLQRWGWETEVVCEW